MLLDVRFREVLRLKPWLLQLQHILCQGLLLSPKRLIEMCLTVNLRLRPKLLEELRPGTRIVSHAFDMGEWQPEQVVEVQGRTIYYWVIGLCPKTCQSHCAPELSSNCKFIKNLQPVVF